MTNWQLYDDVIKWKHIPRYWPFVRENHRSPVNSPHKGQWRGVLMFLWSAPWINGWVNNREAGDLRRHRDHYVVILMNFIRCIYWIQWAYHHLLCNFGISYRYAVYNITSYIAKDKTWIAKNEEIKGVWSRSAVGPHIAFVIIGVHTKY